MSEQEEWGQDPIKRIELSNVEFNGLCERVKECARLIREENPSFSDVNFVVGAMSVFDALGIKCPTTWLTDLAEGKDWSMILAACKTDNI